MNRKPDYKLKAFDKTKGKPLGEIGAAWLNDDSSISLVLNPFVCIHQDENIVYTLFPQDAKAST